MKHLLLKTSLVSVFGLCLLASPAGAIEKKVDCDKGQTIQKALDTAPAAHGDRLDISFTGTCSEEYIDVRRDGVRIDGNDTGTVVGTIRVFGAQNVWLQNMTVTGSRDGVRVVAGNVVVSFATITGNDEGGINLRRGASVWLRGSTVSHNSESGVYMESSAMEVRNSIIEHNGIDGILAHVGSRVIISDSQLRNNGGVGLALALHSVADLRDGTRIYDHNWVGAFVRLDSALLLSGSNNVDLANPAVYCEDTESSFHNEHETPTGDIYCSSFHW